MASAPATPRTVFELRPYDPVLHGAEVDEARQFISEVLSLGRQIGAVNLPAGRTVARIIAGLGVFDRPPIDLAETGRDWAHLDIDPGWKGQLGVV
jgi:hypothetical protein